MHSHVAVVAVVGAVVGAVAVEVAAGLVVGRRVQRSSVVVRRCVLRVVRRAVWASPPRVVTPWPPTASAQQRTPCMPPSAEHDEPLNFVLPPAATWLAGPHGLEDQTKAKSSMQPVPFATLFASSLAVQSRAPAAWQICCASRNETALLQAPTLLAAHVSWNSTGANREGSHDSSRHGSSLQSGACVWCARAGGIGEEAQHASSSACVLKRLPMLCINARCA